MQWNDKKVGENLINIWISSIETFYRSVKKGKGSSWRIIINKPFFFRSFDFESWLLDG